MLSKPKSNVDVKNRILKASEELFAINGYDATGIAQIAEKSEITKSLLYYYFESKEKILEELFSKCLFAVKEEKEKILSGGLSSDEVVNQSMVKGFSFLADNKKMIRILISEMLKGNVKKESFCQSVESMISVFASDSEISTENQGGSDKFTAYTFFFGLAPIIAYMLFGDIWIKNNGLDEATFTEQFVAMAIASFTNDITRISEDFFEPHKNALADNLKKLLAD